MERERKYTGIDLALIRARLIELGFRSGGLHFESNTVYDTADFSLFKSGCLLRLRTQEWPGKSSCILTWKGPSERQAAIEQSLKSREELEVRIESASGMDLVLKKLGYAPVASYEKAREAFSLAGRPGLSVDLDLLPFGEFLEIEGDLAGIDWTELALGLDKNKISLKTYHEINQEWREANQLPRTRDFVFGRKDRERLRNLIGLSESPCEPHD